MNAIANQLKAALNENGQFSPAQASQMQILVFGEREKNRISASEFSKLTAAIKRLTAKVSA